MIIGSRIASGFSLVGISTTCFRFGERFKMGDKFSLFVSPAMMNCRLDPYLEERKWKVSATWSNSSNFFVDFGPR